MQICAAFGSTIYPYALAVKSMAEQAVTDGRQDNILAASEMIRSWGWIILLAGVAVAAVAGAMIGRAVVKNIFLRLHLKDIHRVEDCYGVKNDKEKISYFMAMGVLWQTESRVPCKYSNGSGRSHLFADTLLYYD